MSVIYRIKMIIDDSQVQGLYQLYFYKMEGKGLTKKGFINYSKTQVSEFGIGEYLLSESEYPELTPDDLKLLMKWGLL